VAARLEGPAQAMQAIAAALTFLAANVFVQEIGQARVDKVDILFTIDNCGFRHFTDRSVHDRVDRAAAGQRLRSSWTGGAF